MVNIVRRLSWGWIKDNISFLLSLLGKVIGNNRLLELIADTLEKENSFITYHFRPKMAKAAKIQSDADGTDINPLAIVIQGPIIHKDNFTLETIKIYQQNFGRAKIILSTWDDESPASLRQIEDIGIIVILNQKPVYSGISNINLQITSTRSGMQKAKDFGAMYALKTRTDQRMYAPNLANLFYDITEIFPIKGNWPKQTKRIVGCGLNTFKYRMYGISDMVIYGHINDMLLYWDADIDERYFDEQQKLEAGSSLRSFAMWRVCEVYLATEFLLKVGRELKWTLQDSWEAFADHFCVIEKEQLDFYWPKYNHAEYRWRAYNGDLRMQELSFGDWLNLYTSIKTKIVSESILDIEYER